MTVTNKLHVLIVCSDDRATNLADILSENFCIYRRKSKENIWYTYKYEYKRGGK